MTTDIGDLLTPDAVLAGVSASSKKALFQQLSQAAERAYGVDPKLVVDALAAREKLGPTGFGGGIAIPHGKLDGLRHVLGVFVRLEQPMDYSSIDDLPVDLVFMLLSPVSAGAEHLKALAAVSRRLRDRTFNAKLRGAGSPDAIFALLAGAGSRDAA